MIDRASPARDLISDIVHDLRTPLVPIVGYTEMLLNERLGGLNAKQRDSLSVILRNCHRMQDLVDALLDWVRYKEGRLVLEKKVIELRPLLDELLRELEPQSQERSVRVTCAVPPDLHVRGDRNALRRVFNGMLQHALKMTMRGGALTISTAGSERGRVSIDLHYTGSSPADDVRWTMAEPILAGHGTELHVRENSEGETDVKFDLESEEGR